MQDIAKNHLKLSRKLISNGYQTVLDSIEVYKGDHNKTYLVTPYSAPETLQAIANKRFKVSNSRIMVCTAWIIGDDLYLDYPCGEKSTAVWVAYKI